MRLKWAKRVVLILIGVVLLGLAVLGAATKWSDAVMIALLPLGLFMLVFGVIGVMPSGNWKEGNLQWPEEDLLARVDEVTGRVDKLAVGLDELRGEWRATDERLTDIILALEPPPDDEFTDEERLQQLEDDMNSTDAVVSTMAMGGSGYEDGSTYEEWRASLEELRTAYYREERRQRARQKYRIACSER